MSYIHHLMRNLLSVCLENRQFIETKCKALLSDTELPLFSALMGTLILRRDVQPHEFTAAYPDNLAELPWQGCERQLFETVVSAVRERGHSNAELQSLIISFGSIWQETTLRTERAVSMERAEGLEPTPCQHESRNLFATGQLPRLSPEVDSPTAETVLRCLESLIGTLHGHSEQLISWKESVFQGMELTIYFGFITLLLLQHKVALGSILAAIPNNLDALPLKDSEQDVFDVLLTAFKERGTSDDDLASIAHSMASMLDEVIQLITLFPTPWPSRIVRNPLCPEW